MLPSPEHESLSARSDPRTLKALREYIHRKFPTPMFRLYEHRHTRKKPSKPIRRLGYERSQQPRGNMLPSHERTMRVLRCAVVPLTPTRLRQHPSSQRCSRSAALPWYMALKTPRKEALRSVPQPARSAIAFGARTTASRLKSNIGTKCSAPYIGSVHRKTAKKRSIGLNAQLTMCGCDAAQGPYGGCVVRQTSRTVTFAGCRSLP